MEKNVDTLVEDGHDVILIEGLKVATQIGILDSEKNRTQTVCFDIEMQTVTAIAGSCAKRVRLFLCRRGRIHSAEGCLRRSYRPGRGLG